MTSLRERGAWLVAALAVVAWAVVVVMIARGGGYGLIVPRLTGIMPVAVAATLAALATLRVGGERITPAVWLGVAVMVGFAWNFLVFYLKLGNETFDLLLSRSAPIGDDFRAGLYDPGAAFSNATSGWPPLTLWLGRALALLDFRPAYILFTVALVACAVIAALLSARLAVEAASSPGLAEDGTPLDERAFALVVGLWLFTSYGFMFAVERGQVDLFALVLSLASVWLVVREKPSPWLAALALAAAVSFKVYPALLGVLLLWRFRWRAVLPLVVTNLVLLLIAGPQNLRGFVVAQGGIQGDAERQWWGSSSALSVVQAMRYLGGTWPQWSGYALAAVSAAVWVATLVLIMRRGWSVRGAVVVAAACIPPMCTLPPLSNDYRLVVTVFPLAVVAAMTLALRRAPGLVWSLVFMALVLETLLLARSSLANYRNLATSKYLLLLGLQALLLALDLAYRRWRASARVEVDG